MNLKPDDSWKWYYDNDYDRMMLELNGGMLFCSRFCGRTLNPDALEPHSFCVDDAATFYQFYDCIQVLELEQELAARLLLNSLVACRYLKPLMPKSWHFILQSNDWTPEFSTLVEATTFGQQKITLLVVEANESASLCVIAEAETVIGDKTVYLGDAMKIMNNRLVPYAPAKEFCYDQAV
jgi:cell division protein ZapC